jgi:glycosyltransferase involved in cell wall biosynthesis
MAWRSPSSKVVLLLAEVYPPFADSADAIDAARRVADLRRMGYAVEVIAPSPDGDEFIHEDDAGALVHRVVASRSYLLRPLGAREASFGVRAAEKALELVYLWRREILWIEAKLPRRQLLPLRSVPALRGKLGKRPTAPPVAGAAPAAPVAGVDVILCTYDRLDDLVRSLPTVLAAAARARDADLDCGTTVVYQNDWLPERLGAALPTISSDPHLRLVFASPPSLTHARNTGLAQTTRELVLFTDDDVIADPGLVLAHVAAANRFPGAIGVSGRVLSRIEGGRVSRRRAVGQIRASGHVDSNFDSVERTVTLVPQTPMGVNMSFRRGRVDALVGPAWFDESLTGTAFREETTLAMELFRRGEHFVYAPDAALEHLEAVSGGCANRWIGPLEKRAAQAGLDYLFLHRLYERSGFLRAVGSLLRARRDLRDSPRLRTFVAKSYINLRGWQLGRRHYGRLRRRA